MEYLFDHWQSIAGELSDGCRVIVFLDYDGTLTPIFDSPEIATLDEGTKNTLRELSLNHRFIVGIISGRPTAEIKKLVGVDGLYYSGYHGFSVEGPGFNYMHPHLRDLTCVVVRVYENLLDSTKDVEGVRIENKKFSVALHYRLVPKSKRHYVRSVFMDVVNPYLDNEFRVIEDKMTSEFIPNVWGKGDIVLKLIDVITNGKRDMSVVYVGDGKTDEDAFRVLQDFGVTIVVGLRESKARYYVKGVEEVRELLKHLLSLS